MKKCLFLIAIGFNQLTYGQITFNKTYDNGIDNTFNTMEVNDGYITVTTSGQPINPRFIFVIKVNIWGDTVWQRQYGDSDLYTSFYSIQKLSDASFITGCHARNNVLNTRFIYLLKLNFNGDTIWTQKIPSPIGYNYFSGYLQLTSENKLVIAGQIEDSLAIDGDGFLLLADTNGNYEWHQTYGGTNFDQLYSSVELPDHGFLALGWTRSFGFGNNSNRDVYLVKTDSIGTFEWYKTFGDTTFESAFGITSLIDNNFLIAADKILNNNIEVAWIIKIDSSGNIIWDHTYNFGESSEIWWSRELSNKDIISAGSCTNPVTLLDEGLIFCTDEHGYLKWYRTFPMNNNHACFRDVQHTSDGGFICAGFCFVGASGNQDAWLVKLDSLGCDSAGCANYYTGIDESQTVKDEKISIYPNPASEAIYIRLLNQKTADTFDVSLFNSLGAEVLKKKFLNSGNAQPVDVRTLVKGLYLIKVKAGHDVYVEKVIVN
jgi:hypothetical protein